MRASAEFLGRNSAEFRRSIDTSPPPFKASSSSSSSRVPHAAPDEASRALYQSHDPKAAFFIPPALADVIAARAPSDLLRINNTGWVQASATSRLIHQPSPRCADAVAAMMRRNVHSNSAVPFIPPSLAIKERKAEKQRIGAGHTGRRRHHQSPPAAALTPASGGLEDPKAVAKRSRVSVDEFQYR